MQLTLKTVASAGAIIEVARVTSIFSSQVTENELELLLKLADPKLVPADDPIKR